MMTDGTFMDVLSIVTPILVTAVGWSVRLVINQIRALREDLKEYVRRETCRAHRGSIEREIEEMRHLLKFGRRVGDGALAEMVKTFNEHMDRQEQDDAPCESEEEDKQ